MLLTQCRRDKSRLSIRNHGSICSRITTRSDGRRVGRWDSPQGQFRLVERDSIQYIRYQTRGKFLTVLLKRARYTMAAVRTVSESTRRIALHRFVGLVINVVIVIMTTQVKL